MCSLRLYVKRSGLPVLLVLCLAALSVSYASADEAGRPRALQIIGDPDAAVNGRFAVGTASVGSKALTVVGVIDFLGAGTVHNYFTQGTGNNMQINTNVDESNVIGDASRSQWKLVLGSSLDWFSIRRSPAGGTYDEDALFFIEGSTGNVGIATVDTNNGATIPFTFQARLHVQTASGDAVRGSTNATTGTASGVYGTSDAPNGRGVFGYATASSGGNAGVFGQTDSQSGYAVLGYASATSGGNYGVWARSASTDGIGVYGYASASTGLNSGVYGRSESTSGRGVEGYASASGGFTYGVYGQSDSTAGTGVFGSAGAFTGTSYGVYGEAWSSSGCGVYGWAHEYSGTNFGVYGRSNSTSGYGTFGYASASTGTTHGVYGLSESTSGTGVLGLASATTGINYGVYGQSQSTAGRAVYGLATATTGLNYGVWGQSDSDSGRGVIGYASASTGSTYGVFGESDSTMGAGLYGFAYATSGDNYGVFAWSKSTSGYAVFGLASATTGTNYGVYGHTNSDSGYGGYFVGNLGASGTKSAIVQTQDYGWRHLYAMESPQNWFEDFGQATLVAGEAVVPIEAIFSQTVNLDQPYHVFLTPQDGFCSLYVTEKTSTSFTVRAEEGAGCQIAFDYRIVAPRLGYEDLRLEPAEDPEAVAASLPMLE